MTSPSLAWSMASDFMKSGAPSTTGWSRPLKRTATAPGFTPARSSTSRSRTPVHRALPIAPFSHCPPATRGWNSPRELPEHWLTAASSTRGSAKMSAIVSNCAWLTWPRTATRNVARSTCSGITAQCQRTKNRSLGVNTPPLETGSNTSNGVSSSGGRVRCRIIEPFCGKAAVSARSSGPPFRPSFTVPCARAGAVAAMAPSAPKPRSSPRRLTILLICPVPTTLCLRAFTLAQTLGAWWANRSNSGTWLKQSGNLIG